jgi:predicted nucleic acid-binding Zn ribbon protein
MSAIPTAKLAQRAAMHPKSMEGARWVKAARSSGRGLAWGSPAPRRRGPRGRRPSAESWRCRTPPIGCVDLRWMGEEWRPCEGAGPNERANRP